jgi:hypothetical protein
MTKTKLEQLKLQFDEDTKYLIKYKKITETEMWLQEIKEFEKEYK